MNTTRVLPIIILLVLISLTGGLYYAGKHLRPQPPGGDFSLHGVDGLRSLSDFRGKWVVLYFGFTACPDACPTNLAMWAHAFGKFPAAQQEQLRLVFISVDPERDSPSHLAEYAGHFHPHFVGVTGDHEQLTDVATRYGARYQRVALTSAMGYTIDHTSYSYLINPTGQLVRMFTDSSSIAEREEALRMAFQSGL